MTSLEETAIFYDRKTVKAAKREFSVIVERDEDGCYVASVPAMGLCLHTMTL